MTNIVLLGGNGYIGRNVIELWAKKDKTAFFYVVSRTGNNELSDKRIINIKADVTKYDELNQLLPNQIDYIIDFVGRPEKNNEQSKIVNDQPAKIMKRLAETHHTKIMGFIGGKLGPKSFVHTKADLIKMLQESSVPLAYVEPTVVYGNGRKDTIAKMIPIFRLFGKVNKNMKPVRVEEVSKNLLEQFEILD